MVRELPGRPGLPGPPPVSSEAGAPAGAREGERNKTEEKTSKGQKRGGELSQWSGSGRRKAQRDFPAFRQSLGNHQRENYSEIKRN